MKKENWFKRNEHIAQWLGLFLVIIVIAYAIVSTYFNFEILKINWELIDVNNNMSLVINQTENKLNKTEQFYYDCREKEIRWGSQLIKLGNFTPITEECSYFCNSYNLNYLITDNIAEDKIYDLETDVESYKIKRRSIYTDNYFCLCVSQ